MAEPGNQVLGLDVPAAFWTAGRGLIVAFVVALALGFVAKSLHDTVDVPIHERFDETGTSGFTDVLETITKMGNVEQTLVIAVVAGVVLAGWFARRGWHWWVPLLSMPTAWLGCWLTQKVLTRLVDRERDVLTLAGDQIGGYPSGGVARVILIVGLVAFFLLHYADVPTAVSRTMFGGVAVLGAVEAFTRIRLNQHWFTDVIGGVFFGTMLLVVAVGTLRALDPQPCGAVARTH